MKLIQLKDELKSRKLKTYGNKSELQNRLRAILLETEHGEDEKSKEEEETNDDFCDQNLHVHVSAIDKHEHSLTFRDVEESMSIFRGDDQK
ncbi:hypothetical protein QLX08_005525 [Tetragonisca angustula]|uniref:SAP domain-containing protein n=1 Tax=Tetragonisca angustula TaxID=166442 RepID=A0AAW0ZXW8_9HYME